MNDIGPTAADYTLAGEIANHVNENSPAFVRDWSMASIAAIIARHVAKREAGLRVEIERLREQLAERDRMLVEAANVLIDNNGEMEDHHAILDLQQAMKCPPYFARELLVRAIEKYPCLRVIKTGAVLCSAEP